MQEAIASVRGTYKSFNPDYPLEYTFLDEAVERLYNSEQKTRKVFNYFTLVAILISCLGLYGLAAYMAQGTPDLEALDQFGQSMSEISYIYYLNFRLRKIV